MMAEKLVFLLEEPSMEAMLQGLLPRILSPGVSCQTVVHEGKRDLQLSIPRKLRGWKEPGVRFFILHDQDRKNCLDLKGELRDLTVGAGRADTVIRIVCRELESWFLGDLTAVGTAFPVPGVAELAAKARYRDPDAIDYPSRELKALVPGYQKIAGARRIGRCLDPDRNRSRSFRTFVRALRAAAPAEP